MYMGFQFQGYDVATVNDFVIYLFIYFECVTRGISQVSLLIEAHFVETLDSVPVRVGEFLLNFNQLFRVY